MWWQLVLVFLVEALAVAYLVRVMWPNAPRPRVLEKPDVRVKDLLKKQRK